MAAISKSIPLSLVLVFPCPNPSLLLSHPWNFRSLRSGAWSGPWLWKPPAIFLCNCYLTGCCLRFQFVPWKWSEQQSLTFLPTALCCSVPGRRAGQGFSRTAHTRCSFFGLCLCSVFHTLCQARARVHWCGDYNGLLMVLDLAHALWLWPCWYSGSW